MLIQAGNTTPIISAKFLDSSTGAEEVGVTSATTGLNFWYWKPGGVKVTFSPASLSALGDAYSSGGILHIANGEYRLDIPAAAVNAAGHLRVGGSADGMVMVVETLQVVGFNPNLGAVPELTADPGATPTESEMLMGLWMAFRNKVIVDNVNNLIKFHNNAGTIVFQLPFERGAGTYTRNQLDNP